MNETSNNTIFAALKLIEQLYRDGRIPGYMYRNILEEHCDDVDLALFIPAGGDGTYGQEATQNDSEGKEEKEAC
ncbi:MAG: hypothetical protein J5563_00735 [Clostridia bacterium]|nr:hypothetical protein [Clostridia bacterium]